jgi:hypothetical protein
MDNWDQDAVDLVQPGFIESDDDGLGGLGLRPGYRTSSPTGSRSSGWNCTRTRPG